MSFELVNEILQRLALSGVAKLTLAVLASHVNHESGVCNPSVALLASEAGLSERTVQRVLRLLESAGVVEVVEAGGGRSWKSSYRIHPGKGVRLSPFVRKGDTKTPFTPERVSESPERVSHSRIKGDTVTPEQVREQVREPRRRHGTDSLQPFKDALVEAWGVDASEITTWGPIQKAAAQLRGIGADPGEIPARARIYRALPWNRECQRPTPTALAKHWAACIPGSLETVDRRGLDRQLASRSQEQRLRAALGEDT